MTSLFFSIFLVITAIVGLLINGFILILILLTKQIKSANHILLFHLGTIDICIGLLFLVFSIPGVNDQEWPSPGMCMIPGFLFTLLQPLSLWTICGLNYDRFYIISVPLHYNRIITSKKVLLAIGAAWTVSFLLTTPPFFDLTPYTFIPRLGPCQPRHQGTSGRSNLWYSTIYVTFSLLLPAFFIIFCNIKIFIIARYHRHRIASAIYQVAISAQVAITHQKNPLSVSFGRIATPPVGPKFHNAICTIFQIVGSFFILYLPYYFVILWEVTVESLYNSDSTKRLDSNFYTISSSLLIFTVPVNGFLYGVKSKSLKQILKNYWRKKQNKYDLNQEIQARTPSVCGSRRPSLLFHSKNVVGDVNKISNSSPSRGQCSSNTLQVPSDSNQGVSLVTADEIYYKLKTKKKNSALNFLRNIFVGSTNEGDTSDLYIPLKCNFQNKMEKSSPTILLTKSPSDDSINSSNNSNDIFEEQQKQNACQKLTFEPTTFDVPSFADEFMDKPQSSTYHN